MWNIGHFHCIFALFEAENGHSRGSTSHGSQTHTILVFNISSTHFHWIIYCFNTLQILYNNCAIFKFEQIVFALISSYHFQIFSISVQILYNYFSNILKILSKYYANIVKILCNEFLNIDKILCSVDLLQTPISLAPLANTILTLLLPGA